LGPGSTRSGKGKRVSVIPAFSPNEYGTAGEEIIVPLRAVADYPARLSVAEAAGMWVQYLTAYGMVVELGHIEKGDFVLITAASSSAGLAAIETTRIEGGQSIAIIRKG